MEGVALQSGPGHAAQLASINKALEEFFTRMDREAGGAVATWFTLDQAKALGKLLNRGEELLIRAPGQDDEYRRQRALYGANLRRLQSAFQTIQKQMQEFCYLVASQQQHVEAVKSWLTTQRNIDPAR